MSYVGERVAYLRGLADGMEISADKPENKLLLKIIEVMEDMADSINLVEESQDELAGLVADALDGILDEHVHSDIDDDWEDNWDDEDAVVEYECPHCGVAVYFDKDAFKTIDKRLKCPECGQSIFPQSELPES